jgi:TolB-like protein
LLVSGCSLVQSKPPVEEVITQVAVLPFARGGPAEGEPVPAAASTVLTAQVYGVLASAPVWRFVPDLTVAQALTTLDTSAPLAARAAALGKAVGATAVLCGTVTRYQERQGSAYGVTRPASVAFDLQLVSAASGAVLWSGSFDETQEPLTSNLLDWWQFWEAGPRWMTVEELAHLGVDRLLDDLDDTIQWE